MLGPGTLIYDLLSSKQTYTGLELGMEVVLLFLYFSSTLVISSQSVLHPAMSPPETRIICICTTRVKADRTKTVPIKDQSIATKANDAMPKLGQSRALKRLLQLMGRDYKHIPNSLEYSLKHAINS